VIGRGLTLRAIINGRPSSQVIRARGVRQLRQPFKQDRRSAQLERASASGEPDREAVSKVRTSQSNTVAVTSNPYESLSYCCGTPLPQVGGAPDLIALLRLHVIGATAETRHTFYISVEVSRPLPYRFPSQSPGSVIAKKARHCWCFTQSPALRLLSGVKRTSSAHCEHFRF
jgi:hypothetical protein